MIGSDYTLDLANVFYSGQVSVRLIVGVPTGIILKDVSMTVHSGEVLAVLGSKGSGKKALLDVISRRVQGPVRGQILLNNQPMTVCLFQQRCGYVTHKCDLIEGLTVEQTLYYTPTRLTGYLKKSKVKQVMADLALSQVSNRCIENLTKSEYRRLMIGIQLIKDPVVLLLDEPTWDLNPLNTYLVVSILSNAAKKYGSAVILTMEKPRSDVFPFLDRVLYLCLGDTVYAGGTRQMLEYFDAIEFPCPQLENPLMYYLCLSTVDRRSRERFLESNHQIAELVEKFKIEGGGYRKGTTIGPTPPEYKIPLLLGKIGSCGVAWTVYMRLLAATLSFKKSGLKQFGLRLFLVPLYFAILWLFYNRMGLFQHTFASRSGLILNSLAGVYFLGVLNTVVLYPTYRTRYFQESQEGLYGGTIFLITYNLLSIPFSFISCLGAGAIVYPLVGSFDNLLEYLFFSLILWACYIFAEQQTMATLMIVKDHLLAAIFNIYIICVCLTLSSGILRSIKGLQDWLFYLTYATQSRYAAAFLNRQVFLAGDLSKPLPFDQQHNCTNMNLIESSLLNGITNPYCRYASGQSFLSERYARDPGDNIFNGILDSDLNIGITFAFTLGMIVFNLFLYLVPLPAFVKAKFRE
ncbi:ATP-binding cassette sub-family G member 5 isoform X2 [Dendroctonus ponderosae]|uniref:ATP-binding cassette sub-family G member 5 isoform X2 n=1 Tax=Dendroctonus ponderosae TaxID=77166 RepID=UPI0020366455|nr:ATP-binding cassette sub-family G member 5 isoform X2 [Dendroctonus ponderosae]